jgi:hydroxymethylpyrimidine pyrophosphatase-like HAD family hydrolase
VAQAQYLLAFDFDDTLHHRHDQPSVGMDFFAAVRRLREDKAAVWGINTGRSLEYLVEGLIETEASFLPDFVIAREREIWVPDGSGGWGSLGDWNARCELDHGLVFEQSREFLLEMRGFVESQTSARWIEELGDPAGVIATHVSEIEVICAHMEIHGHREPDLAYQRNTIYLRFCHRDYHKGSALLEVARSLQLGPERTFAMGDGHNDMGMLCRSVAGMIACPANAIREIRQRVASQEGYVASASHSRGAVEALAWAFGVNAGR